MSDPLKQEYQEKLRDEEFGTVLYEVRNDWLTGLVRLREYRVLFDQDEIKRLNAAGGAFMLDVQQILWADLLLHVTRLTDPAAMGGHKDVAPVQAAFTSTSVCRHYHRSASEASCRRTTRDCKQTCKGSSKWQ